MKEYLSRGEEPGEASALRTGGWGWTLSVDEGDAAQGGAGGWYPAPEQTAVIRNTREQICGRKSGLCSSKGV